MVSPEQVLDFWCDDVGPKGWYIRDDALDQTIRDRFMPLWESLRDGGLHDWLTKAKPALAYLIVADQFPRNMFRDDGRAYSTDKLARAAAKMALDHEFDLKIDLPMRQFFYMPLMHSECLTDQDRCVRLMHTRMGEMTENSLLHARAHRDIIRTYGRFPARNDALGRANTSKEEAFVQDSGYAGILGKLQSA